MSVAWRSLSACSLSAKLTSIVLGLKSAVEIYLTPRWSADTSRLLTGKICTANLNWIPNNLAQHAAVNHYISAPTEAAYGCYACWIECALCKELSVCKHATPLPIKHCVGLPVLYIIQTIRAFYGNSTEILSKILKTTSSEKVHFREY